MMITGGLYVKMAPRFSRTPATDLADDFWATALECQAANEECWASGKPPWRTRAGWRAAELDSDFGRLSGRLRRRAGDLAERPLRDLADLPEADAVYAAAALRVVDTPVFAEDAESLQPGAELPVAGFFGAERKGEGPNEVHEGKRRVRFHLLMRLDVTQQEEGPFAIAERLVEALHGLEHQGGRLDCSVGTSTVSGLSFEIELEVDETSIEAGFGVAVAWLRAALTGSGLAEPQWHLPRIEIDIWPSVVGLGLAPPLAPQEGAPDGDDRHP